MLDITKKIDRVSEISAALLRLSNKRAMVGIPAEKGGRSQGGTLTNAAIAYIQENGAPEANIPARPHLYPGVARVQGETEADLRAALDSALDGRADAVDREFDRIGLRAANSIRGVIRDKIPPPLAERTIDARIRRAQSGARRRKLRAQLANDPGAAWSMFTPLINTGQYLRAITYVVRKLGA